MHAGRDRTLPRAQARPCFRRLLIASALAAVAGAATPVVGQTAAAGAQTAKAFMIAPGPLGDALAQFAAAAGVPLSFDPALVAGLSSNGLSGTFTTGDGFARLLAGSGLELVDRGGGAYTLRRAARADAPPPTLPAVTVASTFEREGFDAPPDFPGGQVARGAMLGMLGNADMMNTPVSMVAFTSAFRENIQALSVSDMLRYAVSTQTPQAGAMPTTDVIYVRGFNIGTYDGTFMGLPGLLGRMPPVEAVERVELLLGATALFYGQPYSIGGNINIVPKRAGDDPLFRVTGTWRTDTIFGGNIDAGMRFGPDNAFGVRVNAGYADGNTELENARRRTAPRALAFDYRGRDLRFTVDYMGDNRRLPAETWFVINPGVAVPDADAASRNFRQPWTFYKDTWDTVVARGEWDFAPQWVVAAAYGYMWTTVERLSQVSEIINDAGDMVDAWGGTLGHSKQRREGYAGEIVARGTVATGPLLHRLSFGASQWGDESGYAAVYSADNPFASNIYHPVHYPEPDIGSPDMPSQMTTRNRNTSLLVNDEIAAFDDRLRVILGARRLQYKTEYYDSSTDGWSGDPAKWKWSPGYGVVFQPQPWVSLYANRLEAMDAGYMVQPPATNAGEILPPLPADQTEVGAKFDFGRWGATVALFEIDKPSYFLDPATGIEGANGRQVNRGVELAAFGEPWNGVRLYGSATFLDPKLEQTYEGMYDGNVAVSAARSLASLYADVDVPGVPGLALLGGVAYSGRVYNDEANTQSLPSWVRADAGLRWRTTSFGKPTTVRLAIDNVFGRKYWVSERGTIYMAPGRTFALSMSVDL